ncbi:MAG: aldose 1-epimerase family protein, partial [Tagaea sp.]|nr:aldose 1-epimerase family protein [Tagaea sp.]
MPTIDGVRLTRREFARRVGATRQVAGIEAMEYADGSERGVRTLEFRSGGGLAFSVLVDRSMDIGRFDFRGVPFAWQSGTGFRNPAFMDPMGDGGAGFIRGFSGLLCTCGFDHIRQADKGRADHFDLPLRKEIAYPMHGRGAFQPARLDGYGETWTGDEAVLWCEGTIGQYQVFGESLELKRRIEVDIGGKAVRVIDTVTNTGFAAQPHMLLYHINVGWPVLDEGARFAAPIRATFAANVPRESQQAGYLTQPGPSPRFVQQVFDHDAVADAQGRVPVALINDRLGLGFAVEYDADPFLCLQQWQGLGEGVYGFGIEPA